MIRKWIDAGAQWDGDPVAMASVGGSSMPTGKETVSFMRDIAPVIVGSCTRCLDAVYVGCETVDDGALGEHCRVTDVAG